MAAENTYPQAAPVSVSVIKPGGSGVSEDEVRIMLNHKADRDELKQIADWKANKHDSE